MSVDESEANRDENILRQKILCSLADDFKKYYFEAWRRELMMQRCPSQITLLLAQVGELQNQVKNLLSTIEELKETNRRQRQNLQFVYNQTNTLTENLCEMANLIANAEKNKN